MGKKARKTRWRTLSIADDQSDSEESNTTTAERLPKSFQQKSYYNKFTYSSQSTPRRRYQNDGIKSTRSSSTASENKITFNEDEYTRITTPRQDVLFKKGYLNKPRNYQTQTSTGTSTTSTGNSTGNGTPDYQSTDLEFESQFVFPNGFVDQNGIYYVNGYESYPLMFYNVPTYYPEYSTEKSKRHSSGSLAESTSPNNEEVTSQEQSGGEASNNLSDYSGHHNVYSVVYPGYYVNGLCPSHDVTDGLDQPRRIKKRKRIKTASSQVNQESTEASDEEIVNEKEEKPKASDPSEVKEEDCDPSKTNEVETENNKPTETDVVEITVENTENETDKSEIKEIANDPVASCTESKEETVENETIETATEATVESLPKEEESSTDSAKPQKYDLKPDAEEFVPRAYRTPEVPLSPVQFIKVPPNFVPVPIVPFNGQNFNPAFIPPGIPLNFIPPNPKMFVEFIQNAPPAVKTVEVAKKDSSLVTEQPSVVSQNCDTSNTAKDIQPNNNNEEKLDKKMTNSKTIDIATIVSKLEEAAKEQEEKESSKTNNTDPIEAESPKKIVKVNQKYKSNVNYKHNYYNSLQNSPQKENHVQKTDVVYNGSPHRVLIRNGDSISSSPRGSPRGSPYKQNFPPVEPSKHANESSEQNHLVNNAQLHNNQKEKRYFRSSPEKLKNWKPPYQNGFNKWPQKGKFNQMTNTTSTDNRVQNQGPKIPPEILQERLNVEKISAQSNGIKNSIPNENGVQVQPNNTNSNTKISSTPVSKKPNQWISVCSKKKKKNKSVEDGDVPVEEQEIDQNDQFEEYDVSLLVDVIPVANEETQEMAIEDKSILQCEVTEVTVNGSCEMSDTKVQEIINSIAQMEGSISETPISLPVMKSVDDIERELIEPMEVEEKIIKTEEIVSESVKIANEITLVDDDVEQNEVASKTNKKKPKKGSQKPLVKRVIITDVDLSEKTEEIKTPVKKIVKKVDKAQQKTENKIKNEESQPKSEVVDENDVEKEPETSNIDDDKKKKNKKKKKTSKTIACDDSLSGSSTTLNTLEESFDFFDSVLVGETEEKTNDELSQELDKIIQKGMYSSLEEKIKSMNIDESDGFFKSMFTKIPYRETNVGYSKIPDFTEILQNTTTLGKPNSVSEEVSIQNNNKVLNELEMPTEGGFVLENPFVEVLREREEIKIERVEEPKTLYPITEAVKEWMSRTRETTPDVEILKSPSTIYKEFCDSASDISDTDTEIGDSKRFVDMDDDDEITIFSTGREDSVEQQDLMDYWDDEVKDIPETQTGDSETTSEETVEVYESKYGKNEDFLNIQKEIQAQASTSNPKNNSGLPHRAVCCNIM